MWCNYSPLVPLPRSRSGFFNIPEPERPRQNVLEGAMPRLQVTTPKAWEEAFENVEEDDEVEFVRVQDLPLVHTSTWLADAVHVNDITWLVKGTLDLSSPGLTFFKMAPHDWSGWESRIFTPCFGPMLEAAIDESALVWNTEAVVDWGLPGVQMLELIPMDWSQSGLPVLSSQL